MENTEKKNYKELYEDTKEELIQLIKDDGPSFYEIMHNSEGELYQKRLDNMAISIAKNCYSFDNDERTFVHFFINVAVRFLDDTCPKKDFTFSSIHKMIDLVEIEGYKKCTFEYLLENALKENKHKISDKLNHDLYEILRMCNANYIASNFKEVMHEQIENWKNMFFDKLPYDRDYKESYLKLSFLKEEFNNEFVLYRLKIQDHYLNDGLFKLTSTIRHREISNYDYEKFENKFVRFECDPTTCGIGSMEIYIDGLEDEPMDWETTVIIDREFKSDGFMFRTLNTEYHFEIYKD